MPKGISGSASFAAALLLGVLFLSSTALAQSVADAKEPFVRDLIRVLDGVPGTFGDERAPVSTALASIDASLRGWDGAIRAYADAFPMRHFAVGVLYLDRGRTSDAIAELTTAAGAEPARTDIRKFRAVAYEIDGNASAATADFLAAWRNDSQDPSAAYLYFFHRGSGDSAEAAQQAAAVVAAFARQQSGADAGVAAPFVRVSLLDEPSTPEPVFLPARYVDAARQLHARRLDAAVAAFRDAWAGDPLNADPAVTSAAFLAGAAAFRDGRWSDAISGFQSASSEFARSSEARRLLGTAYGLADDEAKAVEHLNAAIAIAPRDDRARIALADVLIAGKRLMEAERVLADAVSTLPASGQAHWRLAHVFELQHRDDDARRERETALGLSPLAGEGRALGAVARAYASESRFDKATEFAHARVTFDLNDAAAHEQLGQLDAQQGDDTDGLVELLVASLLNPRRAETHAAISQIHLAAGRYADAVEAAKRALERNPRNREATFALARALLQLGREADAKAELAAAEQLQAEELESSRRVFATNLIRIEAERREQAGKWDEAVSLRRDVIAQPAVVDADFVLLGDALSKAGRHADAIEAYRVAIMRDPEPDTYRSLIREAVAAGRAAEAEAVRAEYQRVKRERFLGR